MIIAPNKNILNQNCVRVVTSFECLSAKYLIKSLNYILKGIEIIKR
jgi:hypothetical protein